MKRRSSAEMPNAFHGASDRTRTADAAAIVSSGRRLGMARSRTHAPTRFAAAGCPAHQGGRVGSGLDADRVTRKTTGVHPACSMCELAVRRVAQPACAPFRIPQIARIDVQDSHSLGRAPRRAMPRPLARTDVPQVGSAGAAVKRRSSTRAARARPRPPTNGSGGLVAKR